MKHILDIDLAQKYGVNAAILLENLGYWVAQSEANGENYFDGAYWIRNSRRAYAELFPYMSERQIATAFGILVNAGLVLIKKSQSDDRSMLYTVTAAGRIALGMSEIHAPTELEPTPILQKCQMQIAEMSNANSENVKWSVPTVFGHETAVLGGDGAQTEHESGAIGAQMAQTGADANRLSYLDGLSDNANKLDSAYRNNELNQDGNLVEEKEESYRKEIPPTGVQRKEEEREKVSEPPADKKKPKKATVIRHKYGEYGRVLLSDAERDRMIAEWGQAEFDRCVQYIDEYAQGNGNKNGWKDWNAVLRRCHREGWGLREDKGKRTRRKQPDPNNYDYSGYEDEIWREFET